MSPQFTSRRLLLVAAGMSLLGAAAGCRSPWSGDAPTGPEAAAGPREVLVPAEGSPSPSASSPVPSPAPPSASGSASASSVQPVRKSLSEAENKPVYELDPAQRVVALTIDDGPDPKYTPAVLDLLQQHGIRATFFLIGENAVEHPDLVREIADRGHHIANHTWTHPDLRHMSEGAVRDELERTSDLLHRTTGRLPTWFRAPGGDWSPVSLKVAADLGLRNMGWSVDPRDWSRPGTPAIIDTILKEVRPGAIVLNHDGGGDRSQTVAALKTYLPTLIDSGYLFTAPPN
ncbi:polysaccharide deacetylase family protein [Kitasatospora aureofaciens]|uniref:polysaccharide deacetylase family protein n=1 Tax=Kitasatospora aureofaciens TaxID=1894 RepID=UPI000526F304|nr:polysaccharide deacetylase family protein [Kitasatospora aureofaciens]HJD85294.1 polysaccharide deacetylase family protein [Kitasatospora aureofaciens]